MKRIYLWLIFLSVASAGNAATFNSLDALDQQGFRTLSENLTAATHYKAITPAEPLGTLGFDFGLSLSGTELDNEIFDLADDGDFDLGTLLMPRLSAHKGLPLGFDVGAFISAAPGVRLRLLGAELRYAILKGNTVLPAVGVRATYSTLRGVSELELESTGIELTISKGFANLTPYAGIGTVRSTSNAVDASSLQEESYSQSKAYVGLNIFLGFNFALEADKTGDYSSFSAKAGFRF